MMTAGFWARTWNWIAGMIVRFLYGDSGGD